MPEIPTLATRTISRGESALSQNPNALQDALVEHINADTVKIPTPQAPEVRQTLAKLGTYTILGACGLRIEPYMVTGDGLNSRFTPEVETHEGRLQPYDMFESMKPLFSAGFDLLMRDQPWAYQVNCHYMNVHKRYRTGTRSLRAEIDGGALPDTVQEVIDLAIKQQKSPILPAMSNHEIVALQDERYNIAQQLAYLGIARAGINIGLFENAANLDALAGELQTVIRGGQEFTSFKRSSREDMRLVFPPSNPDWDNAPMYGPTLKCPMHQINGSGREHTPLTNMVYAGFTFARDRKDRFLMNDAERMARNACS